MKNQVVLALSAAALLASLSAQAGGYIQGQAGLWGGVQTHDSAMAISNATWQKHHVNDGFDGRLSFGYLLDAQNQWSYGAEIGYTDFSDNTYHSKNAGHDYHLRYERYDWDLLGVAKYQANDNINVFAKAGLAWAEQRTKLKIDDVDNVKKHRSEIKPEVAVGAGYDFSKQIGVNVSYHYTFGNEPKKYDNVNVPTEGQLSRVAPVSSLLFGVSYSF